jgi:hypothetical protein
LRLELEILNEQYKEKGGLKGMKNPLENLSPEKDNKDSLIVNVSEDWNIFPTFKSSLAEVFDNVGMLHVILFFTLHFNILLFTLLVSDINQFTFSLSVLLVNIISILYLSIRSFNDFKVPNMLTLFKRIFKRGMQAIARFILQYTGESEPTIKQLSKYDQTKNLAVEDRIFQERKTVLNLSTEVKSQKEYKNFMVLTQFFDLPNVLAEIDSDSQVSLLSEEYFVTHLKNNLKLYHFLDEPPMQFSGLGSQLTSKFPPLFLQFKIGAVLLSGRFHVSSIAADIVTKA